MMPGPSVSSVRLGEGLLRRQQGKVRRRQSPGQGSVLVQRKKPDDLGRLSYRGGKLLALLFADFSGVFQL